MKEQTPKYIENFIYNDEFYPTMEDFKDGIFDNEEDIALLPDTWTAEVFECELEPIFDLDAEKMEEVLCDVFAERFPEDTSERDEVKIKEAIKSSFYFDKFKERLPKYYYPTYGAIRRRRLLALKLMRSTKFNYSRMFMRNTKPPLLYSTCYKLFVLFFFERWQIIKSLIFKN